jgi:hypothetical protein
MSRGTAHVRLHGKREKWRSARERSRLALSHAVGRPAARPDKAINNGPERSGHVVEPELTAT